MRVEQLTVWPLADQGDRDELRDGVVNGFQFEVLIFSMHFAFSFLTEDFMKETYSNFITIYTSSRVNLDLDFI